MKFSPSPSAWGLRPSVRDSITHSVAMGPDKMGGLPPDRRLRMGQARKKVWAGWKKEVAPDETAEKPTAGWHPSADVYSTRWNCPPDGASCSAHTLQMNLKKYYKKWKFLRKKQGWSRCNNWCFDCRDVAMITSWATKSTFLQVTLGKYSDSFLT